MANTYKKWKGAVEPAESSPSGNEYKAWRGAVEPVGASASSPESRLAFSVTGNVTRNITRGVTEQWSNRSS